MRERKLKEQFSAVAERLRHAQLTAEQLAALHSVQYVYTLSGEQRVRSTKLGTFLIAVVILLFIAVCLTLSPLPQLTSILIDVSGLQVIYVVALLQKNNTKRWKIALWKEWIFCSQEPTSSDADRPETEKSLKTPHSPLKLSKIRLKNLKNFKCYTLTLIV